ncbi:DUF1456 family protein [Pedobacter nyackensis]|uniref:Uncharacterized protein n=1 Tax=Pedobacter nyackensis TaxID=475255 RepID=A0A1W2EDS2_9SPHI|nr:DUF1456 family protein [Pedobacter nyackensis]SMD07542.1 Protein of unknown function [Pedobacter nyackensis]
MSNNDIFKKLRVALSLTNDDIIKIMELVQFKVSKSELGDIFRADDHPNFKKCGDQILRNFLNGLVIYKRGPRPPKQDKDVATS